MSGEVIPITITDNFLRGLTSLESYYINRMPERKKRSQPIKNILSEAAISRENSNFPILTIITIIQLKTAELNTL